MVYLTIIQMNQESTMFLYHIVTKAREESKCIKVFRINDKRQIIAAFAGNMAGDFMSIRLVYQGKTKNAFKMLINSPEKWHIKFIPNH